MRVTLSLPKRRKRLRIEFISQKFLDPRPPWIATSSALKLAGTKPT